MPELGGLLYGKSSLSAPFPPLFDFFYHSMHKDSQDLIVYFAHRISNMLHFLVVHNYLNGCFCSASLLTFLNMCSSGKCQIVHWRQGHKGECHPPPADHCNGKGKVTCPDRVQGERGESSDGSWGTEKEIYAKSVEALLKRSASTESNYSSEFFSEDDTHDDKPFVNTSGTESSSDSSSWSTFSGPVEPSDDALGSEDLTRASSGQFGSVRSSDISPHNLSESMSVHSFPDMPEGPESDEGFKLTPSVFNFVSLSVNNAFCSPNHKPYVSACKNEEIDAPGTDPSGSDTNSGPPTECQVESVDFSAVQTADTNILIDSQNCLKDDKCTQLDAGSPWDNSSEMLAYVKPFLSNYNDGNSSCGTALSKGAKKLESGFVTVLGIKKSGHVANERSDNALLETKESRCVSSACPLDHLSSSGRVYSVPSDTSSKVDNSAKVSTGLSKSINSVSNSTSDMAKSVGRVIHQIKSSESSRHCSSGITYHASKKYKVLSVCSIVRAALSFGSHIVFITIQSGVLSDAFPI